MHINVPHSQVAQSVYFPGLTWSLEAFSISAARDWALVCVANRFLASCRLRLRIWPFRSSFCSLSFWFSYNTERWMGKWEEKHRAEDKYLDHTNVSEMMMFLKEMATTQASLKPFAKTKHWVLHSAANTTMHIYFGNTYRTQHGYECYRTNCFPLCLL